MIEITPLLLSTDRGTHHRSFFHFAAPFAFLIFYQLLRKTVQFIVAYPTLYQSAVSVMVAEAGFEPTTFGL